MQADKPLLMRGNSVGSGHGFCDLNRKAFSAVSGKVQDHSRKNGRDERIRTSGLTVPNGTRYQAAPHPDDLREQRPAY